MSAMKYTYKSNIQGVALKDGKNFKKGETIPVQVYEFYFSSRGGGESRKKVYYFGNEPTMEDVQDVNRPPMSQELALDKDFKLTQETSTGVTPLEDKMTNNKTIMWLGIIVLGYFAYKQYKK